MKGGLEKLKLGPTKLKWGLAKLKGSLENFKVGPTKLKGGLAKLKWGLKKLKVCPIKLKWAPQLKGTRKVESLLNGQNV